MSPTSTDLRNFYQRVREYTALPDQLMTDTERECAPQLRAEGYLIGLHTAIGPTYAPGPHPSVARWDGPWSVKRPRSLADAATLAALRLTLEDQDQNVKAQAYIFKGAGNLPAVPEQRNGVPLALIMQVPAALLGLDHPNTVPVLAIATLSGGGLTPGRARELLKTHPLLADGSHHLVVGTLKPEAFRRLGSHRGPYDQRVMVVELPLTIPLITGWCP